jgi:hypothetical protein
LLVFAGIVGGLLLVAGGVDDEVLILVCCWWSFGCSWYVVSTVGGIGLVGTKKLRAHVYGAVGHRHTDLNINMLYGLDTCEWYPSCAASIARMHITHLAP